MVTYKLLYYPKILETTMVMVIMEIMEKDAAVVRTVIVGREVKIMQEVT